MKLLVAADLSDSTDRLINKVKDIAKALPAEVWLLHVAEPEPDFVGYDVGPQSVRDSISEEFHNEHRQLQGLADALRNDGVETTALLVQGATAETILNEATKLDADMVVVGSHGRGAMYQVLVGSVSEAVLRKSANPVIVIPTHERS